tara:strand:+ start:44 stop:826 length:783 start_codon:yes stop_codon:yes gene_type:complete
MAKVKHTNGIIVGTINGMNYYEQYGQQIVRKAGGGFNRDAIMNKDSMAPVRHNMSLFGNLMHENKLIRQGLAPLYAGRKFAHLHSKMQNPLRAIASLDPAEEKSEQSFYIGMKDPRGQSIFKSFCFTPDVKLSRLIPYTIRYDVKSHAVKLPNFDHRYLNGPKFATHVMLRVVQLVFEEQQRDVYSFVEAPVLVDLEKDVQNLSFDPSPIDLPLSVIEEVEGVTAVFVGARFLMEQNGNLYDLEGDDALSIGCVAVVNGE